MIKVAATPANIRKQRICEAVQEMQFGNDEHNQNFGISVDSQLAQIKGKCSFYTRTIIRVEE